MPDRRHHSQTVFGQLQVVNYFRAQHAGDIRSSGRATAGRDLFGHATSADNVAALYHQRRESGARQIAGGGQPIVASTHNDRVVDTISACTHNE